MAGVSPPASQKAKIARKSIAVRCAAVLTEQKCVQTMKRPPAILCVLARALKKYGRISARQNRILSCLLMAYQRIAQGEGVPISPSPCEPSPAAAKVGSRSPFGNPRELVQCLALPIVFSADVECNIKYDAGSLTLCHPWKESKGNHRNGFSWAVQGWRFLRGGENAIPAS